MSAKLLSAEKYLIRFICYSFIGWLYETSLWIFEQHQLVNRGFCLGPWLPIYGFGGMLLYYTIYRHAKEFHPFLVFLAVSAAAAAVELVSTYAIGFAGLDFRTLWSYGDYAVNFQERIALLPSLKFGLLGCAIIYFFQEKIDAFIGSSLSRNECVRFLCIFLSQMFACMSLPEVIIQGCLCYIFRRRKNTRICTMEIWAAHNNKKAVTADLYGRAPGIAGQEKNK